MTRFVDVVFRLVVVFVQLSKAQNNNKHIRTTNKTYKNQRRVSKTTNTIEKHIKPKICHFPPNSLSNFL